MPIKRFQPHIQPYLVHDRSPPPNHCIGYSPQHWLARNSTENSDPIYQVTSGTASFAYKEKSLLLSSAWPQHFTKSFEMIQINTYLLPILILYQFLGYFQEFFYFKVQSKGFNMINQMFVAKHIGTINSNMHFWSHRVKSQCGSNVAIMLLPSCQSPGNKAATNRCCCNIGIFNW